MTDDGGPGQHARLADPSIAALLRQVQSGAEKEAPQADAPFTAPAPLAPGSPLDLQRVPDAPPQLPRAPDPQRQTEPLGLPADAARPIEPAMPPEHPPPGPPKGRRNRPWSRRAEPQDPAASPEWAVRYCCDKGWH